MIEIVNTDKDKLELYKYRILKNFIKENVVCEEVELYAENKVVCKKNKIKIDNVYFTDDLVSLIKYTDEEFYRELQQRAGQ